MENMNKSFLSDNQDLHQEIAKAQRNLSFYKETGIQHLNHINSKKGLFNKLKRFIKRAVIRVISPYTDEIYDYYKKIFDEQVTINNDFKILLERKEKEVSALTKKVKELEDDSEKEYQKRLLEYVKNRLMITCDLSLLENTEIDYFDFENRFRGSRAIIKNSQNKYVKFFKGNRGKVLDIGCGRGEFLELMRENDIQAMGIDVYGPFVKYCTDMGFEVEKADALTFLNNHEDNSLGGIFMSQVIEHVSNDYAIALIRTAYKKLKKGAYFILETPNPQNLSTYWNFYLDSSHSKPIHYLTLEYYFKNSKYEIVQRMDNDFSKCKFQLPQIEGAGITNIDDINNSLHYINRNIFGYYDYTLAAKK